MKVSELSGELLDYWAAKADEWENPRALRQMAPGFVMVLFESEGECGPIKRYRAFEPSSNWLDGGPIIELERIGSTPMDGFWIAGYPSEPINRSMQGPTLLIAAMRAYVKSKFGDEVPDA